MKISIVTVAALAAGVFLAGPALAQSAAAEGKVVQPQHANVQKQRTKAGPVGPHKQPKKTQTSSRSQSSTTQRPSQTTATPPSPPTATGQPATQGTTGGQAQ
ncbi:MAG: hypothetical protein U1E70_12900 [Acetobacteraceae bacterium]